MKSGLWPVGLAGLLLAAAYVALVMGGSDWDPTALLAQGVDAPAQLRYAEEILGRDVAARSDLGHDGKFFFILANDPLLLNPLNHAAYLDLPTYRAQRILYPLIAGGFGLLPAATTVWGLIVVNLIAAGLGSFVTAAIARLLGGSRWLGLAFVINSGTIGELDIGGGGVLALALAITGTWLFITRRESWAVLAMTGAVLARELMILCAVGLCIWLWFQAKRINLALLLAPALASLAWRTYAGWRLASLETSAQITEGLTRNLEIIPLRGALIASVHWFQDPLKLAWIISVVVLLVLFVRHAWHSRQAVAWIAWPFAVLPAFLSVHVWLEPYDLARSMAPVLLSYPLLLFAKSGLHDQLSSSNHSPTESEIPSPGRAAPNRYSHRAGSSPDGGVDASTGRLQPPLIDVRPGCGVQLVRTLELRTGELPSQQTR
jgi:hypothetical protein